ncbi:hypothetical protein ABPG74_019293 [Tetrahymena malaccensis]
MDDLILVQFIPHNNEFWNKGYSKITDNSIRNLQIKIQNYIPRIINFEKKEKIAIKFQDNQPYQYHFRTRTVRNKQQVNYHVINQDTYIEIDKPFKYLGLLSNFGNQHFINNDLKILMDKIDRCQARNIQSQILVKIATKPKMKALKFNQFFMGNLNYRYQFLPYSSIPFQQLIRCQALQWQLCQNKPYCSIQHQYLIIFKYPVEYTRILQSTIRLMLSKPYQEIKFMNNKKEKLLGSENINLLVNLFYEIEQRDKNIGQARKQNKIIRKYSQQKQHGMKGSRAINRLSEQVLSKRQSRVEDKRKDKSGRKQILETKQIENLKDYVKENQIASRRELQNG